MPQPANPPPKFQVYREKTFLSSVKLMIEKIFRHGMIEDQCLLCESLHMVKWCRSLQYVYTLHVPCTYKYIYLTINILESCN